MAAHSLQPTSLAPALARPGDVPAVGVGLLFPGQGVQRQGMGKAWRDSESWALVEELSERSGHDVAELLLDADTDTLCRTDLAQIAVFSVSVLALSELRRLSVPVGACAGHSLGEYTALVAAGAMDLPDATVLVAARGQAMVETARRAPGTMAVILGPERQVDQACETARRGGERVWVSNVNGPAQTVVSGTRPGVTVVADLVARAGVPVVRIPVGGPFHCPLMESALPALRQALAGTRFNSRHLPVVANVDARIHEDDTDDDWRELLAAQLVAPVQWQETVRVLRSELDCPLVVLGPGGPLSNIVRRIDPDASVVTVGSPLEARNVARQLGAADE